MSGIIVKPRSRILHGHDWVFSSEILKIYGKPENGSVISIKDGKDKFLGSAIYNAASHLSARRFSRQRQGLDRDFFFRRIRMAWEYRKSFGLDKRPCRAVWSESDGLPGIIIDRYGDTAVLQTLTLAMDLQKTEIAEVAAEVLGTKCVLERNDASGRAAEGLPLVSGHLWGEKIFSHPFEVAGVRFEANLLEGQKTGFYLDQLDSYAEVAAFAQGRRVLDCFSNQGGFALACARAGASEVKALESAEDACAKIAANAKSNSLSLSVEKRDVFEYLRKAEKHGEQWDMIVLDPPSFTRGKTGVSGAASGYREIHLRAARMLSPNGILATFSCSHHIDEADFLRAAADGFLDASRTFRLLKKLQQPLDHPVLLHIPETCYLKGAILQMMPGR